MIQDLQDASFAGGGSDLSVYSAGLRRLDGRTTGARVRVCHRGSKIRSKEREAPDMCFSPSIVHCTFRSMPAGLCCVAGGYSLHNVPNKVLVLYVQDFGSRFQCRSPWY